MSNTIELIAALLDGKTLEKNHAEPDSPFDERETLVCEQSNGRKYFFIGGWGTAYGRPEDRIMDLIHNPEKWTITKNEP